MRAHHQVIGEQVRDVLGARAQRGQLDANDVQAVIQVLAEQAAHHPLLQVLVARGDDAHVDADRGLAPDTVELALGEHPQQAGLQRRRHVADLVQEQRAAVGLLEAPAALRVRPGEGAALVPKQLRLEQVRRNRRGVERDEGAGGARAVLVQCAGDELLAGAGLPGDEHRDARARQASDGAKHLLHRRRPSQQLRHARRAGGLAAGRLAGAGGAPHQGHRLIDVEGLGQVLERAALVGGHCVAQIRVRRHDDDRQRRARVADAAQQLQPRGARHADVGDQHVRGFAPQGLKRRLGRLERPRPHAVAAQRALQHPTNGGVVIDQPDPQCSTAHVSSPRGSSSVKTVRPGSLSNSMMPPLRVTRSWATASPRPEPLARPLTSG